MSDEEPVALLVVKVTWVLGAALTAYVASAKSRSALGWFVLALVMSPLLALIALAVVLATVPAEAARKPTIRSVGIDMLHTVWAAVRYLLERLPAWGAATVCMLCAVYLAWLFSLPALLVRIAGGLVPHPALAVLSAVAAAILNFYGGLVLSRVLLRALPSSASSSRRCSGISPRGSGLSPSRPTSRVGGWLTSCSRCAGLTWTSRQGR